MVTRPTIEPSPIEIPEYRRMGNNYHFDYSLSRDEYVEFDGPLEYAFWLLKEGDPKVVKLCPQPLKVEEWINGKKLNYTFDLWTLEEDVGEILWDVKDKERLVQDVNGRWAPAKWPLIEQWASQRNAEVRFVTQEQILTQKNELLIRNWHEMLRFVGPASPRITQAEQDKVIELVADGAASIGTLLRTLFRLDADKVVSAIVRLVHAGLLTADVDERPFNADTKIESAGG